MLELTPEGAGRLDDPRRLAAVTGRLLDRDVDDELQALVADTAREVGWPLVLVSLVLRRTQYFLAHVGLPPELAVTRATDRCVSFCQYVVASGAPVEVEDVTREPAVAQELAERYGVRAYVGMPLRVEGQVLGAFCVMDVTPRRISDEERRALERQADAAGKRVRALASEDARARRLLNHVAEPAFGEIKNILTALSMRLTAARVAAVEAAPLAHLAEEAGRGALDVAQLQRAVASLPAAGALDLAEELARTEAIVARLGSAIDGLETTLLARAGTPTSFAGALDAAARAAHHVVKLVGGVHWAPLPPELRVRPAGAATAAAVAAALRELSDRMASAHQQGGIAGQALPGAPGTAVVLQAAGLGERAHQEAAAELRLLFGDVDIDVAGADGALRLTWY